MDQSAYRILLTVTVWRKMGQENANYAEAPICFTRERVCGELSIAKTMIY